MTGKTATTLQAITAAHLPVLVIAPKRVAENVWESEAARWRPDLSVRVAAGPRPKRLSALESGADVVVLGRDNIQDAPTGRFRTVVLDELSSFKDRSTARWRAARKVCARARYVWGLTGTPSPNGYEDLWAQMALIDKGHRLGGSLGDYKRRYFTGQQLQSGVQIRLTLRPGARQWIDQQLSDVCLSMRSEDWLDLPPVTENIVTVPMDARTRKAYDDLKASLVARVEGQVVTAANAAVLSGKLAQVTAGFMYPDLDDPDGKLVDLHSAKVEAVREIVAETATPVLVFHAFIEERERLLRAFPGSVDVRTPGAVDAWNAGEVPVLLAHPASAGHGLNLQRGPGHTMVWTTLPTSPEQWSQANARLHRQGQTQHVVRHVLETPDSVDVQRKLVLEGKSSLQDALMRALGLTPSQLSV